jgi:hypothetical protein
MLAKTAVAPHCLIDLVLVEILNDRFRLEPLAKDIQFRILFSRKVPKDYVDILAFQPIQSFHFLKIQDLRYFIVDSVRDHEGIPIVGNNFFRKLRNSGLVPAILPRPVINSQRNLDRKNAGDFIKIE